MATGGNCSIPVSKLSRPRWGIPIITSSNPSAKKKRFWNQRKENPRILLTFWVCIVQKLDKKSHHSFSAFPTVSFDIWEFGGQKIVKVLRFQHFFSQPFSLFVGNDTWPIRKIILIFLHQPFMFNFILKKKSMFFKSPSNFSCWLLHWYEMQISPYANFRGQMQVVVPPTEPYPAIKAFVLYRTWPLRVRFWGTPSWEVNEMIVIVVNPFNPLKDLGGKWCLEGV